MRDTATNVKASWPILKYILITQKLFMFVIDFKEKTEFFDYSFANQCSIIKSPNYFIPAASKSKLSFIWHSQQMKILWKKTLNIELTGPRLDMKTWVCFLGHIFWKDGICLLAPSKQMSFLIILRNFFQSWRDQVIIKILQNRYVTLKLSQYFWACIM